MIKSKFAIHVHIMTLLCCNTQEVLSSEYIAGSLNINPVLVRKELIRLKKAGLIISREGKNGGVILAQPSENITLANIFEASKDEHVFGFAKNEGNPKCPIGGQINQQLSSLFGEIDAEIANKLRLISLKSFHQLFI
jgi:Rrf2 family protein